MKKRKSLIVTVCAVVLVLVFVTLSVFSGCAAKPAGPITLDFVTWQPLTNEIEAGYLIENYINKVNEQAKGELIINVRGGPEVIAPFDLGVSVQKGTIQMANIPGAFYDSVVPGVRVIQHSIYTSQEEREKGIYEYIAAMHERAGMHYLGRAVPSRPDKGLLFMFINKRVEKPEDFVGLKFGGSTTFHGWYKATGATAVTVAPPEYHSAMERGVVDGIGTATNVALATGLAEVSKYVIDPGAYRDNVPLVVNLDTWNRIPKHVQKLMTELMVKYENNYEIWRDEQETMALKQVEAGGTEILTFSPDVTEWFINCANEGSWTYALEQWSGELIPEMRELLTK